MVSTMVLGGFVQASSMAEAFSGTQQSNRTELETSPKVRKPWRSGKYTIYLWEFLCSLLQDPDSCSLITWTNRTKKEFKMVNTSEIAKLWGTLKNRPTMDDKKLLRALRYYYKTKILRKVKGKKGVYQFLSIPYETKECEQKAEGAEMSGVLMQLEEQQNKGEYRERTDSSSSSCVSSENSSRNEDDVNENIISEADLINDIQFFFDDPPATAPDPTTS